MCVCVCQKWNDPIDVCIYFRRLLTPPFGACMAEQPPGLDRGPPFSATICCAVAARYGTGTVSATHPNDTIQALYKYQVQKRVYVDLLAPVAFNLELKFVVWYMDRLARASKSAVSQYCLANSFSKVLFSTQTNLVSPTLFHRSSYSTFDHRREWPFLRVLPPRRSVLWPVPKPSSTKSLNACDRASG